MSYKPGGGLLKHRKKSQVNHCDQCDHWDMCEGCPYTSSKKGETMAKNSENQKFLRELHDMTKCPDCGHIQKRPRKIGEDCDNPDICDSYVTRDRRGNAVWFNPNWG